MDPRSFLENYHVTDIEKDPLPIKVLRNAITKEEIPGQAVHWGFDYLDQRSCPLTLINHILEKLYQEVHQTDFSHCREAADDTLDGSASSEHEMRFEPLKLMRAIVNKLDEICVKEKEDYHDSVDGVVESPDMLPHVFAVSYNNIKNSRRFMEDRMTVLPRMDRLFKLHTPMSYFAVFDGHNGSEAAAYGAAQLHQYLIQSMNQHQDIIPSISDAFESLDDIFIEKCRNGKIKSGSTVVLSLIMPGKLYVAWLGDSQAVLVKGNEVNNLVTPHKPERNDEIDRIRNLGGEVIQMHDTYRVNGNLAVSRAIGDADQKTFIISTPDIKMLELDGSEEFLILACDGLWDEISPEAAAQIVRRQVVSDPTKVSAISQKLVQQAKLKGSQDNISVIVVFLEPLESIKNRYESVLEPELDADVAIMKQSPEPIGVVPMEKFIEHGVDANVPLLSEMNGHSKQGELHVDFLSFGGSKESGAQIMGDDVGNHSDEDAVKKEVEEELSDAESDDEWQFEKPSEQGVSLTTIPTGNGLSENPFETAVLDGAPNDGAMVRLESPMEQPLTTESSVMLEKEQSSETPIESLNPFSSQADAINVAENMNILEEFTGYEQPRDEQFQPVLDQQDDLLHGSNISAVNLDLDSTHLSVSVNEDISQTAVDASVVQNQVYLSNVESAEKPFVDEVKDAIAFENLTPELHNTPSNVEMGNPFQIDDAPVDNRVEFGGGFDFNEKSAHLNQNGVVESEKQATGNPFELSGDVRDLTNSDDPSIQFRSDNTISQGMLTDFYDEAKKDKAQSIDDPFNNIGGDEEYLAQVESNPIPEDMMDEVEQNQRLQEVNNGLDINPFLEQTLMHDADITLTAEVMPEPCITDQPESSVDVQDDEIVQVAPSGSYDEVNVWNEDNGRTSEHAEKFEQEPLIDTGDWIPNTDNKFGQNYTPSYGDEQGMGEHVMLSEAISSVQPVCLDGLSADQLKHSDAPAADQLELSDAVTSDRPASVDAFLNDDLPVPSDARPSEQSEHQDDLTNDQIEHADAVPNEQLVLPDPVADDQLAHANVITDEQLGIPDVIGDDLLVRPDSLVDDQLVHIDSICDYQLQERPDSVQSKESIQVLLAPKFQDMESPVENLDLLSESPNHVLTDDQALGQSSSPMIADLNMADKDGKASSDELMINGEKQIEDMGKVEPNKLSDDLQNEISFNESTKVDAHANSGNGTEQITEDDTKTSGNSGSFDNNWNVVPSNTETPMSTLSGKSQTDISNKSEEVVANAIDEQFTVTEVNLNESVPVESLAANGEADNKTISVTESLPKAMDLPIPVATVMESVSKNKPEGKPTKSVKSPMKPEAPISKGKVPANTAASPKKSPTKPEPPSKAIGLVNGKSTIPASRSASKSTVVAAPKPAASKTAAAPPKTAGVSKGGPLATARTAPVKSVNGVDTKPATTTKTTTASAPRSRLVPAPTASKPSAPKPNTLASTSNTTSPKKVSSVVGSATSKPPMAKPPTTSVGPKLGDAAAKSAIASARARPKATTTTATAVKAAVGVDAKKPTVPKPSTSSTKPLTTTATKPPATRTGPMSARTAPPTKPNKPAVAKTAPKPASDSSKTTMSARTASRPTSAVATKAPVAAKKGESAVLKSKKPSPTAIGKGDLNTKPIKTSINKKVATASNEKAELIQQNGLTSNGENEAVNELNSVNGSTNGALNGINGETEKQDAIKENGVHLDEDSAEVAETAIPTASIEPIQNLLG